MEIKLTQKDADSIIIFLRELLVQEHKRWSNIQEELSEISKDEDCKKLIDILMNNILDGERMEEIHNERVSKLIGFIELLTVGSN